MLISFIFNYRPYKYKMFVWINKKNLFYEFLIINIYLLFIM